MSDLLSRVHCKCQVIRNLINDICDRGTITTLCDWFRQFSWSEFENWAQKNRAQSLKHLCARMMLVIMKWHNLGQETCTLSPICSVRLHTAMFRTINWRPKASAQFAVQRVSWSFLLTLKYHILGCESWFFEVIMRFAKGGDLEMNPEPNKYLTSQNTASQKYVATTLSWLHNVQTGFNCDAVVS